jgi:seryl-tRNA synthetase
MIDLKKVREDIAGYKKICKNKNKDVDVDKLIFLDDQRKQLQQKMDELKHQQKTLAEKKDYDGAKNLKSEIQALEIEYNAVVQEFDALLLTMPNFYHPKTPVGNDIKGNKVTKTR